ncbi:MAG: hypothetical protein MRY83_16740 [Flavobacteriales bacterium]|nr:hypothetical protein [Flavobacteriales bacterium]
MKIQPKKLIAALLAICFLISCKNEGNDQKTVDGEKPTPITVTEPNANTKQKTDGPFEIKAGVISYQNKKLDGTVTATNTFYFDDYGNMLKLEETIDSETSTYLYDQKKGKGLTIFPGRKPSKIRMRQGELNIMVAKHSTSGYVKQNDEAIAGKNCTVYANNAKSAQGESQHMYWKHKGLLLKEINRLGGGYILEAISFEEKALNEDVFSQLVDIE